MSAGPKRNNTVSVMAPGTLIELDRKARLRPPGRTGAGQAHANGRIPHPRDSRVGVVEAGGARLNHRAVWVLQVIGADPGLSNGEVGQRVGVHNATHIGDILRRLRRLGLVLNTQAGRTPQKNAWRLTTAGRELARATGHEVTQTVEIGHPQGHGLARRAAGQSSDLTNRVGDRQRQRIVAAVVRVAFAEGVHRVSVERVVRSARMSRDAFDHCFTDRDAALLAAFEHGLAQADERARLACDAEDGWLERLRVGLLALLELFDEQPELATLLVVGSADAGSALRARRAEVLAELARLLNDERAASRPYPPALSAQAVVGGVLAVLHEQLCSPGRGALIELSGQLMSFIVAPFLGAAAARRELSRPAVLGRELAARKAAQGLLHGFSGRGMRHPLAPRVLHVIRGEPGLSNSEVAERTGVKDEGHMSRTLARLRRLGLIENKLDTTSRRGRASIWQLTGNGEEVERALRYEVSQTQEQRAFRRELWIAKEQGAGANGAVSQTAMGCAAADAGCGHEVVPTRTRARSRACQRLVRLSALLSPRPLPRMPRDSRCAADRSRLARLVAE